MWQYKLKTASTWTNVSNPNSLTLTNGEYNLRAKANPFTLQYEEFSGGKWVERSKVVNTNQTLTFNVEIVDTLGDEYIYSIEEAIEKVIGSYFLEEIRA